MSDFEELVELAKSFIPPDAVNEVKKIVLDDYKYWLTNLLEKVEIQANNIDNKGMAYFTGKTEGKINSFVKARNYEYNEMTAGKFAYQ
ncbi:MAG: hypothetical protein QM504_01640 [Pseudomonadota bacterium]